VQRLKAIRFPLAAAVGLGALLAWYQPPPGRAAPAVAILGALLVRIGWLLWKPPPTS